MHTYNTGYDDSICCLAAQGWLSLRAKLLDLTDNVITRVSHISMFCSQQLSCDREQAHITLMDHMLVSHLSDMTDNDRVELHYHISI